ncbi:hypothetical protein HC251_02990 [Iamia sp. SCSIO 61187]|uniref:hypothetical protein n=1 Tax=Iamia sp. SCSIO 61187 TaxID=2722752 RepID=UPI001C634F3A|nr:hypothetical protein [Iamia sp. SCSIO 61187]QYG91503.1 hypothetical protein HC251_02990 [Iamia sp. SCSIO 61187]
MRSDDELLTHIRQQAGIRRQRRQRALVGAGAAAIVLLLGAGALAAGTGGDAGEVLDADRAGTTTTRVEDPTTTDAPTTEAETTTTGTPTTTAPPTTVPEGPPPTPTDAPTTTSPPPPTVPPAGPETVSRTDVGDGITMTVTATQDPARPGWVDLTVRITADHGSGASGSVTWEEGAAPEHFGPWAAHQPTSCDELVDDDPTTDTRPDASAGPVDDTFTFSHRYDGGARSVALVVDGYVSFCTTDFAPAYVSLPVALAG